VAGYKQPFGKSYWLGAAMFVSALVQKRMQDEKRNKTTIGANVPAPARKHARSDADERG